MKVLVIGGGGREHALVWKIAQSPRVKEIFCAPGNPGIKNLAHCADISMDNLDDLANFAKKQKIDLTVVGPEAPLAAGIVDEFESRGLVIFGPSKAAAQIEASKVFSKNLMRKYKIPTAKYEIFDNPREALEYMDRAEFPIVIKAEGLASGKGVIIADSKDMAKTAVNDIMVKKIFGQSGKRVVVEEFLQGPEVTIMAFCDGKVAVPMVSSRDHKRVFDGNKGPNTGGMGAVSPAPGFGQDLAEQVNTNIIQPTIKAMASEGKPFRGILYAGLIITKDGPKVLEYNCRFGDPETQVVLPRLETDLIEIMEAAIAVKLENVEIKWSSKAAVCIVVASGGYPANYEIGKKITGIGEAEKSGSIVFHAGTAYRECDIVTAGGRVLGVTALDKDLKKASSKAYDSVSKIEFENMHYRKDIGKF